MSQELYLFTGVCVADTISVVHEMSNLDDEDFNGNNGLEYVSAEAQENGYICDREYVVHNLLLKYKDEEPTENTLTNIVYEYCNEMFKDINYYANYNAEIVIENGMCFIAVAYTTDT